MLTPKQAQLHAFLRDREDQGLPCPSMDEMAAAVGCHSRSGAHRLIECLIARGAVERLPRHRRAVRVVRGERLTLVPTEQLIAELARRADLEGSIEALIDVLDARQGDVDAEPEQDSPWSRTTGRRGGPSIHDAAAPPSPRSATPPGRATLAGAVNAPDRPGHFQSRQHPGGSLAEGDPVFSAPAHVQCNILGDQQDHG